MPDNASFYRAILDDLFDGVYFVDGERRITFWNRGAERITGFSSDQVLGRCCAENLLEHVNDCGTRLCFTACPLVGTMTDGQPREAEVYLHHADGHRVPVLVRVAPVRDSSGAICGAVETFSDNSKLTATREHLTVLADAAERDALTGLVNRRGFERRLVGTLAAGETGAALLYLDVDRFKSINDTDGHNVGDQVLVTVANTLAANLRASDCVGRWGGDEFLVLMLGVPDDRLLRLADKLRQLVGQSQVTVDGRRVSVTLSIGATLLHAGDTIETAVKRADAQLYESKRAGRNRVTAG